MGKDDSQRLTHVLKEINEKGKDVKSYQADYMISAEDSGALFAGTFTFKEPNRYRWEDHDPSTGTLVGLMVDDGKTEWLYMPTLRMAFRGDQSAAPATSTGNSRLSSPVVAQFAPSGKDLAYIGDETKEGHLYYILEAKAKRNMDAPEEVARFFFDAHTGLVAEVHFLSNEPDSVRTIKFTNFRLNVPVDDSVFVFSPPPDVQINDWIPGRGEGIVPLRIRLHGQGSSETPAE